MDIYDMLKLWCPAQLPLVSGCQNSGEKVACPLSILSSSRPVLSCSALWNIRRIRRISQASNVKKPTRFIVTSWIVQGWEITN